MTQAQLGVCIGTTQAGVSRYENVDYSSWSLRTLQRIARAFDVRLKVSFEPYGTLPQEVIRFDRRFLEREERKNDPDLQGETIHGFLAPPPSDPTDIGAYKALKSRQTDYPQQAIGGSAGYAASGNF
jgi:transcriptional regulator with XRE-family HTH domain